MKRSEGNRPLRRRSSRGGAWAPPLAAALLLLGHGALHAQAPPADAAVAEAPVDTTITLRTTGSNLEYSPSQITVKAGTRVRIRLVNDGTLPHNVVVTKDADDIDMLGMAAFEASETGYVPVDYEDRMIAYSDLAVPGSTVEMTFVAPPAGEYLFVCLYPGHYNMMIGTLRSLP
ncbi:MAG TPA: plastocyanin/azurin family copper-binding protein [Longimicrobiales bacterium]